ncbi:nuclear transport factor 2 family protein [Mycobacterium sp. NPDC003449]
MNLDETISILRAFYAAETAYLRSATKDFSALATTLHADCIVRHPESLPYAGSWVGHHGVQRWLGRFGDTWSTLAVTDPSFFPSPPDRVFVRCTVDAVARSNGASVSWPMLQMITVKEGLIAEIEPFMWDTAKTLSALRDD